MNKLILCAAFAALTLAGCVNNVETFYTPVPHRDVPIEPNLEPVFQRSAGDIRQDIMNEQSLGYQAVGYSAFNGPEAPRALEIAQAKKVGASLVIYGAKYTDTQNLGAVGSTTYTKYGAFSMVVPQSVRRYDQISVFFQKAPRKGFGVATRLLNSEEVKMLGSNMGVYVTTTVRGSPAFLADVLPGDIIKSINGKPVYDAASQKEAGEAAYGTTAKVIIFRNGQLINKEIPISSTGDY